MLEAVAEAPGDDRAGGEPGPKHLLLDLTLPLVGGSELDRKIKAVFDRLERAEQVMVALAAAVEANDVYTGPHTQRVGAAAQRVGERLGLPDGELETLLRGGLVHDIGKIGIPDSVLLKPGPLSEEEMSTMRQHPVIGAEIVRPLASAAALLPIIRHHHEHFDGSGYPDGLAGQGIPLPARIVAVCDAYDALTSDRPYRRGRSRGEALRVLKLGAGRQWDPELVDLVAADPFTFRPG